MKATLKAWTRITLYYHKGSYNEIKIQRKIFIRRWLSSFPLSTFIKEVFVLRKSLDERRHNKSNRFRWKLSTELVKFRIRGQFFSAIYSIWTRKLVFYLKISFLKCYFEQEIMEKVVSRKNKFSLIFGVR